ncbi:MAG: hypothetical protein FGF50_09180 [Candidatus Brockarchaeota archaeon]|nr:hypothetical protein [Candidatus Brockarchaeota archaeon]
MGRRRTGYGGYALAVLLVSVGVDGILVSTGHVDPLILVSIPLLSLGLYTIVFSTIAGDWRYYLLWGLVLLSVGASMMLTLITGNPVLNFSIALIIMVVAGLIVSRKKS